MLLKKQKSALNCTYIIIRIETGKAREITIAIVSLKTYLHDSTWLTHRCCQPDLCKKKPHRCTENPSGDIRLQQGWIQGTIGCCTERQSACTSRELRVFRHGCKVTKVLSESQGNLLTHVFFVLLCVLFLYDPYAWALLWLNSIVKL